MTGANMRFLLGQSLQHLGGFVTREFTANEKNLFLDLAIDRLIKQRFTGSLTQKGFEANDKRISDLRSVLKITTSLSKITNPTSIPNADVFTLPEDFYFYGFSQSSISRSGATAVWVGNDVIQHSEIGKYIKNDINVPIIRKPVFFISGDNMILLREDTDVISTVELYYLSKPIAMGDDEYVGLPTSIHYEIVWEAYTVVKEITERQSFQTAEVVAKGME